MNANTNVLIPGAAIGGGFYAGALLVQGVLFGVIVAPKAEGEHDDIRWNKNLKSVAAAQSYYDGLANTKAMAEAGSELAKWALGLRIGGHDDWHIPSRDALELIYRNLKPHDDENTAYYRSGENPTSSPVGYPYTDDLPAQTDAEAFKDGGAEAMEQAWYWSSTEYAPYDDCAWLQGFFSGGQDYAPQAHRL